MNMLTHISISTILYKNLKDKTKLDKAAFVYGNMKPDLTSKCLRKPHTLENYFTYICEEAEKLINKDMMLKDFSEGLGEICHYVCDFFCQYHTDEKIFFKLKSHFVYELKLHFELLKILPRISLTSRERQSGTNISRIVTELRNEYFLEPESMEKDIVYALSAAIWICEAVYCFSGQTANTVSSNVVDAYQILTMTGGR